VGRTREALAAETAAVAAKRPDLLEWRVDFLEAIADTAECWPVRGRCAQRRPACPSCSRGGRSAKAASPSH
jgi:hypothetical protein